MAGPEEESQEKELSLEDLEAVAGDDESAIEAAFEDSFGSDEDDNSLPEFTEETENRQNKPPMQGENIKEEEKEPETPKVDDIDPYEGMTPAAKKLFEKMQADLDSANQRERITAGRVSKMQAKETLAQNEANAPEPTDEQFLKAMGSEEEMTKMKEEWPEHAANFTKMATLFGKSLDKSEARLTTLFRREMAQKDTATQLAIYDRKWQTIAGSPEFNTFVYKGGPTILEQATYNDLCDVGQDADADRYFKSLLTTYPDWATEKGNLWGQSGAEASIALLEKFKQETEPKVPPETPSQKRKNLLRESVPATKGKSLKRIASKETEINDEFERGFTESSR